MKIDRSNTRIEGTPDVQSVAQGLGFRCSNDVCASNTDATEAISIVTSTEGVAAYFSPAGRNLACTFLNGVTARTQDVQTWLLPAAIRQNVRLEVASTYLDGIGQIVQEIS